MQRITTLGSTNTTMGWLNTSSKRLAEDRQKLGTGVRFDRASQAPADAADVLRNKRSLGRLNQLNRNIADARLWLDTADTTLNNSVSSLTRARTLVVQGATDTNSPEARAAVAAELRSIRREMISLANTTVNGRPIFAGTSDTPQAYDDAGAFLGDTGAVLRAVTPKDSFSVAASGPGAFGQPHATDPLSGTVFQVIDAAAVAVESGDVAEMRRAIESLDVSMSQMQTEVGRLGGLSSRLVDVESRNEAKQIATKARISEVQDVDMAEAIVRLRSAETSYEATLSSVGRALGTSLLDFLR